MKKRGIYALLMALCLFSLATLYSHIARVSCSFVITGAFSKEQANRFTTILNSNELVTASASYSRKSWATLQDEHQRRTCYADLVLSFGEFTPAYPIRMLSGRFLLPEDKNKIVLAAQQASALFCSYQCEGHTVLVNGSAYEVVGVYQTDSPYAKLSIMGLTEAYVSSEGPFTHWPVTAANGKEAQLAFSLCETLRCMGVSDASAAPVYRHRAWLFFALYVQIVLWSVLSCIRLWKQKRASLAQRAPGLTALASRLLMLLAVVLFLALLRGMPVDPSSLPTTFSWDAICSQVKMLLCQWNTRIVTPCMETVYDKWMTIGSMVHFTSFWLLYGLLKKEGTQCVIERHGC